VIEPAKATLDAVNALFTNAGLDLDAMLAAGPDSLKAHIACASANDEELAAVKSELESLKASTKNLGQQLETYEATFNATGFKPTKDGDVKAEFAAHVKKAAALELAKAGHPPVVHIDSKAPGASASDAEIHAQWKAMTPGADRLAFFSKHEAAIRRASGLKQ